MNAASIVKSMKKGEFNSRGRDAVKFGPPAEEEPRKKAPGSSAQKPSRESLPLQGAKKKQSTEMHAAASGASMEESAFSTQDDFK